MSRTSLTLIFSGLIWCCGLAPTYAQYSAPDWSTLDRLHAPLLSKNLQINGATSCAAASCHGGPKPGVTAPTAIRGSEYQLWKENDPHANSWVTITNDQSVAIMRRLGIMIDGQIVDQAGFDNCLACHNTTQRFGESRSLVEHQEGVGCAACHGPSEHWLGTHFQYSFAPETAAAHGFVNAGDLYSRARMCASCHVGDKDRDMNHDIIAAGHPELKYELSTYHARQPKHWRDAESRDPGYYHAQLWLAGQVAATDASLSLLNARASSAHAVNQWPEFAAYECASCHHSLGLKRSPGQRSSLTARYSHWSDVGLRWLIEYRQTTGQATAEDLTLIDALDDVAQLMQTRGIADRQRVTLATDDARRALTAWFDGAAGISERQSFRSERLGRVIASAAGKHKTFTNWESSVQFYLAAVAARASWPGGWDGPLRDLSEPLRVGLQYPRSLNIQHRSHLSGQATITARDAMRLGVHLAGSLGPITLEPVVDATNDTEAQRQQLRQMIEQINQRWDKIQEADESEQPLQPGQDGADKPIPRPTQEELLEQLRQRESRDKSDQ